MAPGTMIPPSPTDTLALEEDTIQHIADGVPGPKSPTGRKSFLQLLNISVGFLGIQFGWMIQMSQMGPLLERLGSSVALNGLIQSAGPITGIVVQPIIGSLSDDTRSALGRRRPFLLMGAAITAFALFFMPHSPNLLVAAILLWLLDASLNTCQGPYRALVPDVVPKEQQATTYALMSLMIGLGSMAAAYIGSVIPSMEGLFYLGGTSILVAMVWTVLTTPEPKLPPVSRPQQSSQSALDKVFGFITTTWDSIVTMPAEAKKLCLAHSFTWFGLGCLFFFFSLYVPHQLFHAQDPNSPQYQSGVQYASWCYFIFNTVCFMASALITKLCQHLPKKPIHTVGLLLMGASFISMYFLTTPQQAMIAMGVIGIGWATTLSIPFALLSDHVPPGREGVLMGTFNIFIAAPQVVTSLLVGRIVAMAHDNVAVALLVGGIAIVLSALLLQLVKESHPTHA